jgi:predicted secreted protein
LHKIWSYKKKGQVHTDIRTLCGTITDAIIKYSMQHNSADNVSVIFIAFKNFENKMKDPNFEYTVFPKVIKVKEKFDFSSSSQ